MKAKRILIAYPGPIHSTFDVATGYEKALGNLGHTVYGYPYHKWLGFYEQTLRHWETVNDQYDFTPADVSLHSSEKLIIAACEFIPDVILVISGSALHAHAFRLLYNLSLPVVLILTESPYEDETQAKMVEQGHIAHAFTNERLSVDRLGAFGVPVTYLPHSFDPDVHKPTEANGEHQSGVFFHGTIWPERAELFDVIFDDRVDMRFSGIGASGKKYRCLAIGNAKLAQMYSGAKICLNHHRTIKRKPGVNIALGEAASIGPRAYEIAACGAFQLCDDTRQELWDVFGESVPTYKNAVDLRAQIEYYINRPDERQELAALSHKRVQDCTFERRAAEIVEPILRGL